jgi:predicted amidohydrolase
MWVVGAAKAGKEDGHGFYGGSCIVAQSMTEGDEVIIYDCDPDLGEYIKKTIFNFEKHRRIEHYKLITEQTGVVVPEDLQ